MELWVAVVSGVFGLASIALASLLQIRSLRNDNDRQHGESLMLLSRVDERSSITLDRVEQVSDRLDDHLEEHRVESRAVPSELRTDEAS